MKCVQKGRILALLALLPSFSVYASGNCALNYAQLQSSELFSQDLAARISRAWDGLVWQKFERRALPPGAITPIELGPELERLSEFERRKLLEQIKKSPPPFQAKEVKEYLILALGDEEAWEVLLKQAAHDGGDRILYNYLTPHLLSAPADLRESLLRKINALYPEARKLKERSKLALAPKRAMDFLLRHLLPPDKIITAEIKKGASARDAWESYFRELHRALPSALNPPYGTEEVLDYARRTQKLLQEKGWDKAVLIGGSLPSGKAEKAVSDVDIFSFPFRGIGEKVPELDNAFAKGPLGGLKPGLKVVNEENITSFSRQNPIFLRVTKDKIELIVYPALEPLDAPSLMRGRYPTRIESVYPLP